MFREWDFLIGEIWTLLVLAAYFGLATGWLIWGRRIGACRAEIEANRYALREKEVRISSLEEETRSIRKRLMAELDKRDPEAVTDIANRRNDRSSGAA